MDQLHVLVAGGGRVDPERGGVVAQPVGVHQLDAQLAPQRAAGVVGGVVVLQPGAVDDGREGHAGAATTSRAPSTTARTKSSSSGSNETIAR